MSLAQNMQHQMRGWLKTNQLKVMRKKTFFIYCTVTIFVSDTQQKHEVSSVRIDVVEFRTYETFVKVRFNV
jgi:Holliday junction resolvase-like predicted endonuclease